MRIISKFTDYYDGGAVYGIDPLHTYIREKKEIEDYKINHSLSNFSVIGFCGELYVVVLHPSLTRQYYPEKPIKGEYFLIGDDAIKYKYYDEQYYRFDNKYNIKDGTIVPRFPKGKYNYHKYISYQISNIQNEYNELKNSNELKEIFLKYKTPIFLLFKSTNHHTDVNRYKQYGTLILNIKLKDLEFFKIKNTTTAFQEVEQYISNILVSDPQGDVTVGDDIVIRDSKGFDDKSFKKEPSNKKLV